MELLPTETPAPDAPPQRQVTNACFSPAAPTPISTPQLAAISPSALSLLGLDADAVAAAAADDPDEVASYLCGNTPIPGGRTGAHCYAGHQFGYFSGQLGDGATMYAGETVGGPQGRMEIQYKGAGKTPFSRTADGRKVLRSSLREYVASEVLASMGVPTTRAGSLVVSDKTRVVRDVFYDGNPSMERTAVITRIAPSFLRFGSFEIARSVDPATGRAGPSSGNYDILDSLATYVIDTHYPHLKDDDAPVASLLEKVAARTGTLVAHWQGIGFCHGVLNTDNMSVLGLTIDYGPYGFMEAYNPRYVCNGSDDRARYTYEAQPEICAWNCAKLAQSLAPLLSARGEREPDVQTAFAGAYQTAYVDIFRAKLGLGPSADTEVVTGLIESLFGVMETTGADFTKTFRKLTRLEPEGGDAQIECVAQSLGAISITPARAAALVKTQVTEDQISQIRMLKESAPHLVAHIPDALLDAEEAKLTEKARLASVSEEDKRADDVEAWRAFLETIYFPAVVSHGAEDRVGVMNAVNPAEVPRNAILQAAIDAARDEDYSLITTLVELDWFDQDAVAAAALPSVDLDSPLVVT